jgi:phosphoglycerate dehydrogenase-like enzyme
MKTLFLGGFAAGVAPLILAKTTETLDPATLADEDDPERLVPALAEADIVVSHVWRSAFPPAPRLKLLQSVAAGIDLIDLSSLPSDVMVCNVFGHEQAIAEYAMMTMLVLTHRLFDTVSAFRAELWNAGRIGGSRHGEMLGRTIGIVGYGRIGREVAKRAVGFGCRVLAANRSPIAEPAPAEAVFPLSELDRMLPQADAIVVACGLAPETRRLIDRRRLALMKPGALLINVARAPIVDEEALYTALRNGRLGGAALDVWWRYPTVAEPLPQPSRYPFHELPNVLMTPHCSSATDGTAQRRWSVVADNLDRFVRGEPLANVVVTT